MDYENNKIVHSFCFSRHLRALKHIETVSVCFTELPASTLPRTKKQTGQYHSAFNRLVKPVRLIQHSHWFLRNSVLKLDNQN